MRDAIDQYYADKNKYPASLDTLVSDGYLRRVPEDPITHSADTWQTVPAEPIRRIRHLNPEFTTSRVVRRALRSMDRLTRTGKSWNRSPF